MMVETGLCRAKNASHTSAMNFMIYPLGGLAFWVYGFAIGWGNWWNGPVPPGWYPSLGPGLSVLSEGWGLGAAVDAAGKATGAFTYGIIGTKGWFLTGAVNDVSVIALFFLHDGFHGYDRDDTDRCHGGALVVEELLFVRLVGRVAVLPLRQLGLGRWLSCAGRSQLGSRSWRCRLRRLRCGACDGRHHRSCRSYGHRSAYWQVRSLKAGPRLCRVTVCRWLLPEPLFWLSVGLVSIQVQLSRARIYALAMSSLIPCSPVFTGAIGAQIALAMKGLKPDPTMLCNGMLAGLVAITAPCAFVNPVGAAIIGAVAGVLSCLQRFLLGEPRGR